MAAVAHCSIIDPSGVLDKARPQQHYNDDLGDLRRQSDHQGVTGVTGGLPNRPVQTAAIFFQYNKNQRGDVDGHHAIAVRSSNVTTALAGFRVSSIITQVGLRRQRRLSRSTRTASSLDIKFEFALE